jgi:hypothetical protein
MYDRAALRYFRYLPTILRREWLHCASEELHPSETNPTIQAAQPKRDVSVRRFRCMKNRSVRPSRAPFGTHGDTARLTLVSTACKIIPRSKRLDYLVLFIDSRTPRFYWKQLQLFCLPIRNSYSLAKDKT